MAKKQEVKNKGGRPKTGKKTVSIRLSDEVIERVKRAAEAGGNLSAYIEQAIKVQLQKDGIR
jgi:predicted DNA-binding protein